MSVVIGLYHIVISTKGRQLSIPPASKQPLYAYMRGILMNKGCQVHAMNGVGDHVHILIDLPSTKCLSDVVRDLKRSSSLWMAEHRDAFPIFAGWASEYAAFSCSPSAKADVVKYISQQESHHQSTSFDAEYALMLRRKNEYDALGATSSR